MTIKWSAQEDALLEEHLHHKSHKEIAALLPKRTTAGVKNRVKVRNLTSYKPGRNPRSAENIDRSKYTVDDSFFSKTTIETCYWAGFLAADGCVSPKNNGVKLKLAYKDKEHLELFKTTTKFTGPMIETVEKGHKQVQVTCSSKQWKSDLENFGVVPKKSLILEPPQIKDIDMVRAFIRGYIDGDSSIMNLKQKAPSCKRGWRQATVLSIVCGSEDFLHWIRDHFSCVINSEKSYIYQRKDSQAKTLVINGQKALRVLAWLSEVETPCLSRKWKAIPKVKDLHDNCKLSKKQVAEIRRSYATGTYKQKTLGAEYGVHQVTISKIVRNERYNGG